MVAVVAGLITLIAGLKIHAQGAVAATRRSAGVGAGIGVVAVAVVAGFPLIHTVVAATLQTACSIAAIAHIQVAVVAGLTQIHHTVAAALDLAATVAAIAGFKVAVVAGFAAFHTPVAAAFEPAFGVAAIAGLKVAVVATLFGHMTNAIAAARLGAGLGAGIGVDGVAVVAGLARIHTPVATNFRQALRRTPVFHVHVAVVALFKTGIFRGEITTHDAVAADRFKTGPGASIGGIGIAVVAGFFPSPHHAVAAARRCAGVQTTVGVHVVAVVAQFVVLHHAVAAARRLAVVAGIRGVVVAVVAALTGPQNPITATRFEAIVQARIAVFAVAVIASFVADRTGLKVRAQHPIATAWRLAHPLAAHAAGTIGGDPTAETIGTGSAGSATVHIGLSSIADTVCAISCLAYGICTDLS